MNKKIEDYLPFYFGCECVLVNDITEEYDNGEYPVPEIGDIGTLNLINKNFNIQCGSEAEEWPYGIYFKDAYIAFWDCKDFKLLLRPLNNISQKEYGSLIGWCHFNDEGKFVCDVNGGYEPHEMSDILIKLRKAGFDCDKLIECGLAIDKNTLQNA